MKNKIRILALAIFCLCFAFATNAQENNSVKQSEKDKPLKILTKLKANMDGSCGNDEGTVSLLVTFESTGKIGKVKIIESSGCNAFDQNAAKVAKKIKFEPAIKNGEAITVEKTIKYKFIRF